MFVVLRVSHDCKTFFFFFLRILEWEEELSQERTSGKESLPCEKSEKKEKKEINDQRAMHSCMLLHGWMVREE